MTDHRSHDGPAIRARTPLTGTTSAGRVITISDITRRSVTPSHRAYSITRRPARTGECHPGKDRPTAAPPLAGRDAETSVLHAFVADVGSVGNALAIAGEPGTGRTALLGSAISAARAGGVRVAVLPGAEVDRGQRFAGIRLLVARLSEASVLPPARRAELDTLLADPGTATSRLAVFTALLTALRDDPSDGALLIAVDDVRALDDASTEALAFVARRLRGSRTGVLIATRERGGRMPSRGRLPTVRIGPLPAAAGSDLLAARFPDLSAEVRDVLVAATGGLPLALVECAAALTREQRVGAAAVPDLLPVSEHLRDVLTEPLAEATDATRLMVLMLALDPAADLRAVHDVTGLDVGETLAPAVTAGLVAVGRSGAITFPRPVVRSAVVAAATAGQRRHARALLAAVRPAGDPVPDVLPAEEPAEPPLVPASRTDPDADRHHPGRCVAPTACPTCGRDVSPDGRGRLAEASRAFDAGLLATARQAVVDAVREPGVASGTVDDAMDLLLAICHLTGSAEGWQDFRRTVDQLGPRAGTPASLLGQLVAPGDPSPIRLAELDAALDRLAMEDDPRVVVRLATAGVAIGRGADCRVPLWRVLRDDTALPRRALAAALLAGVAVSTGDGTEAARVVDHGLALCRAADHVPYAMLLRSTLAVSAASVGDPASTALADEVLDWATTARASTPLENVHWAWAREALGRSDHVAAYERFEALDGEGGIGALLIRRPEMALDIVEAAAGSGRTAPARTFARRARRRLSGRLDFLALGARALADPAAPADWFSAVYALRGTARWPFDVARIRLLHGEHLKRAGERELACEHLNRAMDAFQALGAEPWVTRAAGDLRLAGEAVVGISQDRPLTRRESTVAELAALGLTNQEIADQLHLSARTVASHLYRIFDKVGVTSRAQLSAALAPR